MTREATIKSTILSIEKLPDDKLQEVSNFISFILKQCEEKQISQGIQRLTEESKIFEFLKEEEDLYSIDDLKEVYNA